MMSAYQSLRAQYRLIGLENVLQDHIMSSYYRPDGGAPDLPLITSQVSHLRVRVGVVTHKFRSESLCCEVLPT